MTDKTTELIEERGKTHGDWLHQSSVTQQLKKIIREHGNKLSEDQRESLDSIAIKIGRILAGNSNHKDHWSDIGGYSRLVADSLED